MEAGSEAARPLPASVSCVDATSKWLAGNGCAVLQPCLLTRCCSVLMPVYVANSLHAVTICSSACGHVALLPIGSTPYVLWPLKLGLGCLHRSATSSRTPRSRSWAMPMASATSTSTRCQTRPAAGVSLCSSATLGPQQHVCSLQLLCTICVCPFSSLCRRHDKQAADLRCTCSSALHMPYLFDGCILVVCRRRTWAWPPRSCWTPRRTTRRPATPWKRCWCTPAWRMTAGCSSCSRRCAMQVGLSLGASCCNPEVLVHAGPGRRRAPIQAAAGWSLSC